MSYNVIFNAVLLSNVYHSFLFGHLLVSQVDEVTIVFGSCFFGAFYTAFFTFIVVGGFFFFCVWSRTREIAYTLGAQIIGVSATIILKVIVIAILRQKFYKAFYRKKPAAANIMNVVMEAWNIGLSLGYALARATKLIVITAIYLGRIDTPFLDKGVGFIGGAALDEYPYEFRKDLMLRKFVPVARKILGNSSFVSCSLAHCRRGPSTSIFGTAGLHLHVEAVPWTRFCVSRGKLLASVVRGCADALDA